MQQLSGLDSFFLYDERGTVYNHVAALGIYDPSTARGGRVRFKDILAHFGERLDASPIFRRRLVTVPHGVDRPYWIEDKDVDLEFHVRHLALPHPGDWRQLMIQVARLHSRPLDRSRPLWEVYVIGGLDAIEGLPRGSFALFMKFHHASGDGMAMAHVIQAIHAPLAKQTDAEAAPIYRERDPTAAELYARAVVHGADRVSALARFGLRSATRFGGLALGWAAERAGIGGEAKRTELPSFVRAPHTRFNAPVSANRVVEAIGFPMAEIRRVVERAGGATVNDVFLSLVGGALRAYLDDKGELPAESLTALMPIALRKAEKGGDGGNDVGGVPVPLHTEIWDPLERLRAVRRSAAAAKRDAEVLGRDLVKSALEVLPHAASEWMLRHVLAPRLNVAVSNVRGPEVPLHVAGARAVHFYPVSIATDYIGLNHTAFSYNGTFWVTAVACRNMLPDPAVYAACLRRSWDELVAAVEALPAADAAAGDVAPPKRSRRKPSSAAEPVAAVPSASGKNGAASPAGSVRKENGGGGGTAGAARKSAAGASAAATAGGARPGTKARVRSKRAAAAGGRPDA